MKPITKLADRVEEIEQIMLQKFKTEPFHNLYLLNKIIPSTLIFGGTCSDKTLSFLQTLRARGFEAYLHSAFIRGKETHRLVRVHLGEQRFYADIGNGWPSIRLYPQKIESSYSAYGMRFRTEIDSRWMRVFHLKNGIEQLQLELEFDCKGEEDILLDIKRRYDPGFEYPFSHSLRFAQIVDDSFLFLRGEQLEVFRHESYEVIAPIPDSEVPSALRKYFDFDINAVLLDNSNNLDFKSALN